MRNLGIAPILFIVTLTAVKQAKAASHSSAYPLGAYTTKQVWFWEKVFGKYSKDTVLIHDARYPEIIVDIIDFKILQKKYGKKTLHLRSEREKVTERYLERYQKGVRRFKKLKRGATRYGPIEARLFNVYRRSPKALSELYRGMANLRTQTGLATDFNIAAKRADKFLPEMERAFRSRGVPTSLTRLAFVESMFNTNAVSKVGASGIWQFMPGTARRYMYVNHYLDERNSPQKATKAAARLLIDNYRALKSWPLAITAYNHGQAGMRNAVKKTGTRSLDRIIARYKSPSFGFASRNFYAEFLAARNVYERQHAHKARKRRQKNTVSIKLTKPISLAQIIRFTPLSKSTLRAYNPCLLPKAFNNYRYSPLPKNYELFVPKSIAKKVAGAISTIKPTKRRS